LVASGDEDNIGIIEGFNQNILRRFGYTYNELRHSNLDILMSKILSDKHDWLMKRYFTRNQATVMGKERAIFAMDRNGFIMSVNLLIKVVPNLGNSLRIVGLMTTNSVEYDDTKNDNLDIEHQILFHFTAGTVYGVSKGCFYEFGIRPDITDGRTRSSDVLNISDIFPTLGDIATA
jgi:PAS domain S-box-containing protein